MKSPRLHGAFVLNADQRRSRHSRDRVPGALAALAAVGAQVVDSERVASESVDAPSIHPGRAGHDVVRTTVSTTPLTLLPFERTAGDEIQAVLRSGAAVVACVQVLVRLQQWRMGIGIGQIETPWPRSTRAGRGPAYLAARSAVEATHASPGLVCIHPGPSPDLDADARQRAERASADAESALRLLVALWSRRSPAGWEVVDLLDRGLTRGEVAAQLGVSGSAVSQRATTAVYDDGLAGADLVARLLDLAAASVVVPAP